MRKSIVYIKEKPKYDLTEGQILILPSYSQVKNLDPCTKLFPDFKPIGSRIVGVDFLGEAEFDISDLAYSYKCIKQKLIPVPFASSRNRLANILIRRFAKKHLKKRAPTSKWKDEIELISCGTFLYGPLYSNPLYFIPQPAHKIVKNSSNNSCLKKPRMSIGAEWMSLLSEARRLPDHDKQQLINRLADLIINPFCHLPVSRQYNQNLITDKSKTKLITSTLKPSGSEYQLKTIKSSYLESIDFSIYFDFPGSIKSSKNSKVSFNWVVKQRRIPDPSIFCVSAVQPLSFSLQDTLLKVDTVNQDTNVYLLPEYCNQSEIDSLVSHLNIQTSLIVQPILHPKNRLKKRNHLDDDAVNDVDVSFVGMDGEILEPMGIVSDLLAESAKTVVEIGHSMLDFFSDIMQAGHGIGM